MVSRVDIIGQNGNDALAYCLGTCRTKAEHLERHAQGLGCMGDQFVKHDSGKTRYSLIPPECLSALAEHLTYGAEKYKTDNWKKVDDTARYYDALLRHLEQWRRGDQVDDQNKLHLTAVFSNAMFLLWFDLKEIEKNLL